MSDRLGKEIDRAVQHAIRGFSIAFGALGAYAVFAAVLNWPAPF